MNDDVLCPCGGFLPVLVDEFGYIRHMDGTRDGDIVHRECRDLYQSCEAVNSLTIGKLKLPAEDPEDGLAALLELDGEGGGAFVWVRPEHEATIAERLARFRGCYGAWPIRVLSGENYA